MSIITKSKQFANIELFVPKLIGGNTSDEGSKKRPKGVHAFSSLVAACHVDKNHFIVEPLYSSLEIEFCIPYVCTQDFAYIEYQSILNTISTLEN